MTRKEMGKNAKGRFQNEIKNKFLLLFRKLKIKQSEREKIRFFFFFHFFLLSSKQSLMLCLTV